MQRVDRSELTGRVSQGAAEPVRPAAAGLALVAVYTLATLAAPGLRLSVFAPGFRIALEMVGLCVALVAAFALLLPEDNAIGPTRDAFVAALVMLGVATPVFRAGPILFGDLGPGSPLSFYPWLLARYFAGGLFLVALVGRPHWKVREFLLLAGVLLVLAGSGVLAFGQNLPVPHVPLAASGPGVPIGKASWVIAISLVPAILFAVGAWLAGRAFVRGDGVWYFWLAVALAVQVLANVHEPLYATVLGPEITSADLLRALFLVLLLVGAMLKIRQLARDRAIAVAALARDLEAQQELLATMHEFTEREQAFRSIVVHELMTPIATVRAFAHVLSEQLGGSASPDAGAVLEGIRAESSRLQGLVDRMDELRHMENGEFTCEPRPVRVRPLLEDAATYVRGLPGWHRAVVDAREERADADPLRVGQALRNMVTNAARYSPPGAPIYIEAEIADAASVQIAVVDEGPGIPEADRGRVLNQYERGAAGRTAPGAGLGLYVARKIAEAHGGRLFISDAGGRRGARVVLELPALD